MTVPSRGVRSRRSVRRPGWLLVTALLVLAILASSTLVFTNRVDLLRLAVILSLWAAVMAAFVSVTYRRQSELDQARARDMKFVYDLQLDREVAARREYELAVEAHLRRQLARELRTQAADEMTALRAELASLRSNLEMMLGTDLGERPALESERIAPAMPESERIAPAMPESERIAVAMPESERIAVAMPESERIAVAMPEQPGRVESSRITPVAVEDDTLLAEDVTAALESPIIDVHEEPLAPPPEPEPVQYRGSHRRPVDAVAPQPVPVARPPISEPPVAEPTVVRNPAPPTEPAPQQPEAPWRPPEVRRGRHWSAGDSGTAQTSEPDSNADPGRGRHWVPPEQTAEQTAEEESAGAHTGGQSVADLMSRLQVNNPVGGGGRRRRED